MTLADDRALDRFPSHDPATGEALATWPVDDEARSARPSTGRGWPPCGGPSSAGPGGGSAARLEVASPGACAAGPAGARGDRQAPRRRQARDHPRHRAHRLGRPARAGCSARAGAAGALRPTSRPPRVPAARRGRRDRAVELPGVHPDGLDRLRAGGRNAVVFKPSELTPAIGDWLVDVRRGRARAAGAPAGHRPRPTGAALARTGVDKLAFTGSSAPAKVMAACAETLTPVLIECGGKDALIVTPTPTWTPPPTPPRGARCQRRADLHRDRAGLRGRRGVRRVPRAAARRGDVVRAGSTRRRRTAR